MQPKEPTVRPTRTPDSSKPLLTGPKRQHYLPQFYLENFSKDGLVAVYDRESDHTQLQQPVNTGVIGHFYTMVDAEGRKRFEIEQLLSQYESKCKPVIDRLAERSGLNADERSDLAIFVALAAMRTPDIVDSVKAINSDLIRNLMRRMFCDADDVALRLRQKAPYAEMTEDELAAQASKMVEMAQTDGVKVQTDQRWAVSTAIQTALQIAPIFSGKNWVVIHSDDPRRSFITSDSPVLLASVKSRADGLYGFGFGSADALVFFPMKSSCVLAMCGDGGDLIHIAWPSESIRRLNLAVATRCKRFVIGRDEKLLQSLVRATRLGRKSWQPKFQLG